MSILSTLVDCLPKVKNSIPETSTNKNSSDNNNGSNDEDVFTHGQLDKLQRDLKQILAAVKELKEVKDGVVGTIFESLNGSLDYISQVAEARADFPSKQVQAKLLTLKHDAIKLKSSIPLYWRRKKATTSAVVVRSWSSNSLKIEIDESSLKMSPKFLYSSIFTEFQEAFKDLDITLKLCLLSFAILPANVVLKKRLLIDWWVGEGLVDPPAPDEIFAELVVKGFIEPVKESHKLVADRFKMQPHVQHAVIMFAQDARLFGHHYKGITSVNSSECNRAYLVNRTNKLAEERLDLDHEKLQTILNINESFPDQRFGLFAMVKKISIVDWFSKMKKVSVLHLGRWQSSGRYHIEEQSSDQHHIERKSSFMHHIEVESTEFLKGLKNMKWLKLLSLQGISRINELPNSIGKLTNLRILDLKACHNLEVLPDDIASLKKLLRLDISECYLLDDMPKSLASLSELRVLKGFVIGTLKSRNSCTLEDLVGLRQLSQLSINTSSKAFPSEKELLALRKLKVLKKLAITWSCKTTKENSELNSVDPMNSDGHIRRKDSWVFTKLEKLELQCFPHNSTPNWLIPGKLTSLKKLHIAGGELINLGKMQEENDNWTVEILRLKHLRRFNMDWNELQTSFPKLLLFEKEKCPEISSCPFIEPGVWLKH